MSVEIMMPRLGVNDDKITLAKWEIEDGEYVNREQILAVIETSKETSEIKAEESGIIHLLAKEGEEIVVGSVIARIGDAINKKEELSKKIDLKITEKAKKLAEEKKVDLSIFPHDKIIREKDIIDLLHTNYKIEEINTNKVLIYGGGGFGQIAVEILRAQHCYRLHGVIDSNFPQKKDVLGAPVIGDDSQLSTLLKEGYTKIINGVGFLKKAHWRKAPYEMLRSYGFEFINVIHKSAQIEASAQIGVGNLICAGSIIGGEAIIGNNCIINAGAIVSHFSIVSDHCHIASGAVLASAVVVGENTLIGQNCTVYSDVVIGKNVTVMNGRNVFKNVPENTVVEEDYR